MITTFKGEVGKSRDCTFEFYDWCWFNNLIKKESIRLCSRENSRDFPINLGSFWFLTYSMLRHAVGLLPLSQVWPFTDRSFLGAKSEISLPLHIACAALKLESTIPFRLPLQTGRRTRTFCGISGDLSCCKAASSFSAGFVSQWPLFLPSRITTDTNQNKSQLHEVSGKVSLIQAWPGARRRRAPSFPPSTAMATASQIGKVPKTELQFLFTCGA